MCADRSKFKQSSWIVGIHHILLFLLKALPPNTCFLLSLNVMLNLLVQTCKKIQKQCPFITNVLLKLVLIYMHFSLCVSYGQLVCVFQNVFWCCVLQGLALSESVTIWDETACRNMCLIASHKSVSHSIVSTRKNLAVASCNYCSRDAQIIPLPHLYSLCVCLQPAFLLSHLLTCTFINTHDVYCMALSSTITIEL